MLDLVIVNYKSTDYLNRCLRSFYQSPNGSKTNVYVFDNGSGDHVDQIKASYPEVNLLKHRRNLGFSRAVNTSYIVSMLRMSFSTEVIISRITISAATN